MYYIYRTESYQVGYIRQDRLRLPMPGIKSTSPLTKDVSTTSLKQPKLPSTTEHLVNSSSTGIPVR